MSAIELEPLLRSGLAAPPSPMDPISGANLAAVALVVAGPDLELLFIKRAQHPRDPWSGHVALPGGRRDPDDGHIEETARRETLEEVGLALDSTQLWGQLEAVQARARGVVSQMWVVPHVYRISDLPPPLQLDKSEVETARWIAIEELLRPDNQTEIEIATPAGKMRLPAWSVHDFTIWGLTYFVVQRFLEPLLGAR